MTTLENIVRIIMADLDSLEEDYHHNRSILGDDGPPWNEFAIVLRFFDDDGSFAGSFGRLFDPAGVSYPTLAPDSNEFEAAVKAYENSLRPSSGEVMKRMLIQYNRETGRVRAEYEYDDDTQWEITPANLDAAAAALRPVWD